MDIFGVLQMVGGLALFLYGMQMMSGGLEAAAATGAKVFHAGTGLNSAGEIVGETDI